MAHVVRVSSRRYRALPSWVCVLGSMLAAGTSGDPLVVYIATLIAIWSLWSSSLNLIWGYAGQFSMAQVGLGAVSAYVAAILVAESGWAFWPAAAVGVAVSVLLSLLIGLVSLRLAGFYFGMMTLVF